MVDAIEAKNIYIRSQLAKLPEVERGEKRTFKRGDCLWNIAKEEAKKHGKTSNVEINDYMLLIAKLNGLDTSQKMNGIKIGSEIFLPGEVKEGSKPAQQNLPEIKPRTPSEASFSKIADQILNDKTLFFVSANLRINTAKVYHLYVRDDIKNVPLGRKLLCSVETDSNNKVRSISFDDDNNVNPYAYDYDIDSKGNIKSHAYPFDDNGNIEPSQLAPVIAKIQEVIS